MSPADPARERFGWLLPIAIAALVAGVFFRFWDLGGAPLAVDEYFLGTSTLNTAQRWLPEFACGGYYTRGLLVQYLSLPLLRAGFPIEFTVRFWPAVASVLSILAVWRLGLLAGGRTVGAIAVILTSLSLWEVEFGRFGRMYSPFQAMFVWYVYFQAKHLLLGKGRAAWWYLALSAVAVLTYEGASMLLALNFLALVWRDKRWSIPQAATALGLLAFGIAYNTIKFRPVSPEAAPAPAAPHSTPVLGQSPITLPDVPDPAWPILVFGVLLWRNRPSANLRHPTLFFWALPLVAFALGFVALGAGLVAAGILMRLPVPGGSAAGERGPVVGALVVLTVAWVLVVAGSGWFGGEAPVASLRLAIRYVLDYPDVYYRIVQPWLSTIPGTTILLVIMALPALHAAMRSDDTADDTSIETLRYLFATVILMALVATVLRQPYEITRYTYFLYPILLVLAAAGVARVAARFLAEASSRLAFVSGSIVLLFLVTEDFGLRHLLNINETAYRFRTAYDGDLATHYYPRWDFRGAADFVNERLGPKDSVIVFDQPFPHYLNRTSGIFIRAGTSIHEMVATCSDRLDRWSNAPLLASDEDIEKMIASTHGNVWLLARSAKYAWRDPFEVALETRPGAVPVYTSEDGSLVVYRIGAAHPSG